MQVPAHLHFGTRSRAFLRVQDGCRLSCSYCIIPTVRGPSRSVPADDLVSAVRGLRRRGFHEIVLTGVNTGDWGRDLEPRQTLDQLLGRLLDVIGDGRLRLNSLEPLTVTPAIIERLSTDPRIAPHLQIPLQSGSNAVLGRMRRNYRAKAYFELLDRLNDWVPNIGLGADVIVGFPGETNAEFDETAKRIAASPLSYLHVFSWSPRPGTPAAELRQRVPERVIRERNRILREIAASSSLRFRSRQLGSRQRALVLEPKADGARTRPDRELHRGEAASGPRSRPGR